MRRLIYALLVTAAFIGVADAQVPFTKQSATVSLSVSNSSSRVALGSSSTQGVWLCNTGATLAYVEFGDSTVAATTASIPIPSGLCGVLSPAGATNVAAITASSITTITATPGAGFILGAGGGGSGGGGGGAVSVADGADVAEGALADAAATVGGTGSLSAKLRRITTQLDAIQTGVTAAIPAGTATIGTVGQLPYPVGATPYTATATGTTAATTATLAGASSVTTYLCGFSIRANATAAATGNATVTGVITATLNFTQWTAPNASGLGLTEMIFAPCIPASATNTSIAVVSAAPGTGGVVSVTAWGYKL